LVRRGEPNKYSALGLALLFGLPPDELDPDMADPVAQLSDEQREVGQQRWREAQSAWGSDEIADVLAYWAALVLGRDVLDTGDWIVLIPKVHLN
jgi:hypothetical protein